VITTNELRRIATRSGARQIRNVEIDVILTLLLQMFYERGLLEHLAFKGGTMLRKMVFGPRGRLSTDLDFTLNSEISRDDIMMALLEGFGQPYRGLRFQLDQSNDWYLADESCGANPLCAHDDNPVGIRVKLQISLRERPILPIVATGQLPQEYFDLLDFAPAAIPSLAFEEVLAEKVRAASQRSKIRDLHDLSESLNLEFDRSRVRGVAVLKLWKQRDALSYERLAKRIEEATDYDVGDLTQLLRKDQRVELSTLIKRVVGGYRFLSNLIELESKLTHDEAEKTQAEANQLIAQLRQKPWAG
jgi:predicted nucleotidyltransferase component of viral defense system